MSDLTGAMTLNSFLAEYDMTRQLFYILKSRGEAPKFYKAGRRIYISREAAEEWRKNLEEKEQQNT